MASVCVVSPVAQSLVDAQRRAMCGCLTVIPSAQLMWHHPRPIKQWYTRAGFMTGALRRACLVDISYKVHRMSRRLKAPPTLRSRLQVGFRHGTAEHRHPILPNLVEVGSHWVILRRLALFQGICVLACSWDLTKLKRRHIR